MARQDINEALAQTGFLYGGNAAYIEDLYARYEADPKSVDEQWQSFFGALKDDKEAVLQNAKGASLARLRPGHSKTRSMNPRTGSMIAAIPLTQGLLQPLAGLLQEGRGCDRWHLGSREQLPGHAPPSVCDPQGQQGVHARHPAIRWDSKPGAPRRCQQEPGRDQ